MNLYSFTVPKPHIFVKWVNPGLGCLFPTFYLGRGGWLLTEFTPMDLLNNLCSLVFSVCLEHSRMEPVMFKGRSPWMPIAPLCFSVTLPWGRSGIHFFRAVVKRVDGWPSCLRVSGQGCSLSNTGEGESQAPSVHTDWISTLSLTVESIVLSVCALNRHPGEIGVG